MIDEAASAPRSVGDPPPTSWGPRVFWGWIILQLLIPAIQLGRSKPALFGWQMYSRTLAPYEFDVVLPDGERRSIDLDAYVTVPREEIPWQEILPSHLCSGMPLGTIVESARGLERSEIPCT